jgi:cytochrome oxidase assembly protein ShyY1
MPETLRKKPNKQKQISFLVTWFGLKAIKAIFLYFTLTV